MVQAVGNQLHAREVSGERGSQGCVAPSSAANVSRDVAQLLSLQALERKGVHEHEFGQILLSASAVQRL